MDETLSVIFATLHSADLPIDAMIHLACVWRGSLATGELLRPEKRYKKLCVVAWMKHLLSLKPGHFRSPAAFLFTLSNGRVLGRDKMVDALQAAARRIGVPEKSISVISLRSGVALQRCTTEVSR